MLLQVIIIITIITDIDFRQKHNVADCKYEKGEGWGECDSVSGKNNIVAIDFRIQTLFQDFKNDL